MNALACASVAEALDTSFGIPHWVTGIVPMVLVGAVIIGGVKRIGNVASALVPTMAIAYIIVGLIVLLINASEIPAAFGMIFTYAFSPVAATDCTSRARLMIFGRPTASKVSDRRSSE